MFHPLSSTRNSRYRPARDLHGNVIKLEKSISCALAEHGSKGKLYSRTEKQSGFRQTKGALCLIVKHTYMSRKHHRETLEKRGLTDNLLYTVAGVIELVSLLMSWVNVSVSQ